MNSLFYYGKKLNCFVIKLLLNALIATLRQIYVNGFVTVPLDWKKRTEEHVSGPVLIWFCILYFINFEGKLETSPPAFTNLIINLFLENACPDCLPCYENWYEWSLCTAVLLFLGWIQSESYDDHCPLYQNLLVYFRN